ncbi:hypothetical protein ACHAQH_005106 [Verticillium albo-atrum]
MVDMDHRNDIENEAEALSKEHGSVGTASVDAPPSRGDVDQQVLLEEVHEHNPERRFVIIPNSTESSNSAPSAASKKNSEDKEGSAEPKAGTGGDYEANTTMKYGPSSGDENLTEPRVPLERRKTNLFVSNEKPVSCDFGSSPWYRIAWLLTLKNNQPDMRLFRHIAKIAQSQPCPGDRVVARAWYSIQNPSREGTLPDFAVCYECAKTIEVLLPSLTGIFVPTHATANPTRNTCAMRYHPDRKRFVLYFDAMETTCDKALATISAPNIPSLAKTIDRISMFAECREDRPVAEENWHVMQYLPELTVCGDCFDDVVRPRLLQDGQVARNFYMHPQRLNVATCQLYSNRMREIFRKACRRNDVKYLEGKVLERQKIEAGIHAELARLDKRRGQDEWTEKEMEKLISTWRKWE